MMSLTYGLFTQVSGSCIFRPGHISKMVTMPIDGKNLKKSSSPEPLGRLPLNIVCGIWGVST